MIKKKTPGVAPGMNLDEIRNSISTTKHEALEKSARSEEAGSLLSAVALEIQAEKENEDLTTLSARVPKDVARRIKKEALTHDLKVGVYLRKILSHAFPPAN